MPSLRNFLEKQGFHRVPLKKLKTGHYKLPVTVNHVPGMFILDTGASTSCIGFDGIPGFLLKSETSEIKASGAGAVNMDTKISRRNLLSVGEKRFKDVDFVLFDLSHINEALGQVKEAPVHGILGADLLKKHKAVIDYGRNALYFK